MTVGGLLVFAALFLAMYNNYVEKQADEISRQALDELNNLPLSTESIPYYVLDPDMDMPVKTVNGRDYVGTLSIPVYDMELPVIAQWSYSDLKVSPCVYQGTPYKNNMIIAAHNYRSHFGNLKNLVTGNKITFTDNDGNTFDYEVLYVETLGSYDTEKMTEGEWDLTLFTCTYGGADRVTVRCQRIE